MVETEARAEMAELIDDIAAARMATMRKPRMMGGISVTIKMGKMKSLERIPGRASGSGIWKG